MGIARRAALDDAHDLGIPSEERRESPDLIRAHDGIALPRIVESRGVGSVVRALIHLGESLHDFIGAHRAADRDRPDSTLPVEGDLSRHKVSLSQNAIGADRSRVVFARCGACSYARSEIWHNPRSSSRQSARVRIWDELEQTEQTR